MQEDNTKMGVQSRECPGSPHKPSTMTKKAYAAPVLVTWGTLRDMTMHVGHEGHLDGGKKLFFRRTR
jgi:hypothetical protein